METIELYNDDNSCKIRSAYVEGKGYLFSVYDFINLACEKELNSDYGKHVFKRWDQNWSHFSKHKFPGQGQRETPVMNIRQLQQLLMLLPGEIGNKYRDIIINNNNQQIVNMNSLSTQDIFAQSTLTEQTMSVSTNIYNNLDDSISIAFLRKGCTLR
jgi:hypothetical protein